MSLFSQIRDSLAASIATLRDKEKRDEELKRIQSEARKTVENVKSKVTEGVGKYTEDLKKNPTSTPKERVIRLLAENYDHPLMRKVGQTLQKFPEIKIPENVQETIKKSHQTPIIGIGPFGVGPNFPAVEATNFAVNLPGDIIRGYGKTAENLSTKEGVKQLVETPKRLVENFKTKGINLQSGIETIADPGVQDVLNLTDFLPGGLVAGLAVGSLKAISRKGGEKLLKEVAEKGAKAIPEELAPVMSKAASFNTAEDFIKKGLANLTDVDKKAIEKAEIGLRDLFDAAKAAKLKPAEEVAGFASAGKLIDESRFAKVENPVVEETAKQIPLITENKVVSPMVDTAKKFKTSEEFSQYLQTLEGDKRVAAIKELNGKSAMDFYNQVTGVITPSTVDNLPLVADNKFPVPEAPPGMKERGFVTTVREAGTTAPEVAGKVEDFYGPVGNPETLANAQSFIDKNGIDAAIGRVRDVTDVSAEKTAVGLDLMRRFQEGKQFNQAVDIAEELAKQATNQGQAIQALSMWSRLTPEGALAFAQRTINTANKSRGAGKQLGLSAEAAKEITDLAADANKALPGSREQITKAAKLMDKIAEQIPASLGSKIATFQTVAQLLNPKTFIRNIVGNLGFGVIENIKDLVAYPIDLLTSVATGRRSKALPSLITQAKGAKTGFKLGLEDALKGINTAVGATQFELPKKLNIFSGLGEIGKKIDRGLQVTMDVELRATDRSFFNAAYEESLRQQMKAAGLSAPTEAMVQDAVQDGLYRTFQDETVASILFSKLKSAFNVVGIGKKSLGGSGDFGLGDLILKYPKTPGNILARAVDYSPAGFLSATYELARPFIKGEAFRQKRFVEGVSRALTGTFGLIGTGAILHKMGIITGSPEAEYSGDADLEAEAKNAGLGEYRLNASALSRFVLSGFNPDLAKPENGDLMVSYDWFQPQSISLAMGADIDANKATAQGFVGQLVSGIAAGSQTLAEQPLVSGLDTMFRYGDIPKGLMAILAGAPASMVPTIFNQARQLANNTTRNTTDPDLLKQSLNQVKMKIPFLSNTLPERITTRGVPQEMYQNGTNDLFNVMFNPAFVSRLNMDPVGKEVFEIFKESGETQQAPRLVSKTIEINGKNIKLNGEQIGEMQKYVGKITNEMFSKAAADPNFQALPPEKQAQVWSNMMADIFQAAKIELLGHRPKTISAKVRGILNANRNRQDVSEEPFSNLPLISPNR